MRAVLRGAAVLVAGSRVGTGAEQQTDEISPPRSGGLVQRCASAAVAGVDIDTRFRQKAQDCRLLLRRASPFLGRARLHRLCDEEMQGPCPVRRAGIETVREQPLYPPQARPRAPASTSTTHAGY